MHDKAINSLNVTIIERATIDTLLPAADMEKLEVLDLEGNKVDDLGALVYLGWCPQLAILNLADNPVAQEPDYSAQVLLHCISGC